MKVNFYSLCILLLSYIILYCFFNVWYEDFETQYEFAVTGYSRLYYFGDFDFLMNNHLYNIFISLYKWNNSISWRAYFFSGITLLCAFLFIRSLLLINVKNSRKILMFVITLLLLSNNLIFLNFTRVAMITVATGWLVVLGFFSIQQFFLRHALGIFLIVLGSFIRFESSLLASAIVFAMVLFKGGSFMLASIRNGILPAIFIVGYFVNITYTIATSNYYYHLIEPDVEYAINIGEERRVVPLSDMKNKSDSLRYNFAMYWQVDDSLQINPKFLRSIITYNNKKLRSFNIVISDFKGYFNEYGIQNTLLLFVILLVSVYISFYASNRFALKVFLLFLWFAVLYFLPGLLIRTEARVQEALIFCFWICWVLLLKDSFLNIKQIWNPVALIGIYIFVLYSFVMGFYELKKRSDAHYKAWKRSEINIANLEKNYPNYYIYPYTNALELFMRPAFKAGYFSSHFMMTSFAQMSYTPSGKKIIENFYGCNFYDYPCRFQHIKNNKHQSIFIGGVELETLFTDYLAHFYNLDFKLQKQEKLTDELYVYKVL